MRKDWPVNLGILSSGKVIQVNPNLSSVDAGGTNQKVDKEQEIKQGSDVGRDAARGGNSGPDDKHVVDDAAADLGRKV